MTKKTIIDGVDVAGCEHRSDTHNTLLADGTIKKFSNYCYITNDGCYGVKCYYKQLKKYSSVLKEIGKLSENAYCLTNGTNKDMAEFAKTINIKVNEVLYDT